MRGPPALGRVWVCSAAWDWVEMSEITRFLFCKGNDLELDSRFRPKRANGMWHLPKESYRPKLPMPKARSDCVTTHWGLWGLFGLPARNQFNLRIMGPDKRILAHKSHVSLLRRLFSICTVTVRIIRIQYLICLVYLAAHSLRQCIGPLLHVIDKVA